MHMSPTPTRRRAVVSALVLAAMAIGIYLVVILKVFVAR